MIEMARALNLTTIAEGVEAPEQEVLLRGLGVDQAQGYYYAWPASLDEMVAYLSDGAALEHDGTVKAGPADARRLTPRNRPAAQH